MNENKTTIGDRIRQRRKELNLTQDELAKRMGYSSRTAISNVEKGGEDLTSTRIKKYAEALDCSPAYLMGWSDHHLFFEDNEFQKTNASITISDWEDKKISQIVYSAPEVDKELAEHLKIYAYLLSSNKNIRKLIDAARHSSEDDVKLATEFLMRLNKGNEKDEG